MKNKNLIRSFAIVIALLSLNLAGCKKDRLVVDPDTSSLQQLSKDQQNVDAASDDVQNDVNDVLSGSNKSLAGWPCNLTVDSSSIVGDTITYSITFNGLNCAMTHTRYGNATVKRNINTPWRQAGTKVTVNYYNVVVTRVATGKSVTFNGTRIFENVTGGYLIELGGNVSSISYKVTGQIQVTFEDNTTKTWNISKLCTFTGSIGQLVLTTSGTGSANGYSNLLYWGTNRHGELFYNRITQPVAHKQACIWRPVSGSVTHEIPSVNKSATITFGYDNNNQLVTNNDCPTKYRLDWQQENSSGTIYLFMP